MPDFISEDAIEKAILKRLKAQYGFGIDKAVFQTEFYQLPAPIFETTDEHTRSVLFAHRELREMDKEDRIRACHLHACLKYVQRNFMTNTTLRGSDSVLRTRTVSQPQELLKIPQWQDLSGAMTIPSGARQRNICHGGSEHEA